MRSILIAASLLASSAPAFACSQEELMQKTQELVTIQQELAKDPTALAALQQKMIPIATEAMTLAQEAQKDPTVATSPEFMQKSCDLIDKQLKVMKGE